MSDKRPFFIFVSAEKCPFCIKFENQYLEKLRQTLNAEKKVSFLEIKFPSTASPVPKEYPRDLLKLLPGYPAFVLIPHDIWITGMAKPESTKLTGLVFNTTASSTPITEDQTKTVIHTES